MIGVLRKMLKAETEQAPCNAVWSIARCSLNHCLVFDMAVVPP